MELFEAIRRDDRVEQLSVRALADKYGVHRRMVRQALANAVPPERKTPVRVAPKLEPAKGLIDAMLTLDLTAPRKQRHTARRILARLVDEHELTELTYSAVRDYVARRRPEIWAAAGKGLQEAFVPQTHLMRRGVTVGEDLVRDLMRELDLVACQPRPFRVTTIAGADGGTPDLLQRNFTATAPGHKLVGDITYIHTWAGFGYLATVIDCYSKAVIGWAVADHMRTDLVIDALAMARRNHTTEPDCIFHSDRGTQYTSHQLGDYLRQNAMRPSMGNTGICWDNAMAESFFAALKNELVHRTAFPTIDHVKKAVASYIEVFYNRERLHSGLGYKTPHEVHTAYRTPPKAA